MYRVGFGQRARHVRQIRSLGVPPPRVSIALSTLHRLGLPVERLRCRLAPRQLRLGMLVKILNQDGCFRTVGLGSLAG